MDRTRHVVLYHPRTLHERNYANFWIPYSVVTVGSAVGSAGYRVEIIDDNREHLDETGLLERLRTASPEPPLFVGISAMIGHQIRGGFAFANTARRLYPQSPIVWGGPAPSLLPQAFEVSPQVDIIVRGTGERAAVEIAGALQGVEQGRSARRAPGEAAKIWLASPLRRERLERLDFGLVPVAAYLRDDPHISGKVINYVSSLGCPFGCGFCTETALYHRRWSAEPSGPLHATLDELLSRSGADGLKFYDANFFVNKSRVLAFAAWARQSQPGLRWAASAHPRNLARFDDAELAELRNAGLSRILIGAESANDDELRYIKKDITPQEVETLAERLANACIHGSFTFIVGYPGFPLENVRTTLEFGARLAEMSALHEVKAHVYAPYPGTPLFADALRQGFRAPETLEEWADYDYYETQTPWISEETTAQVRAFNERFCPYVL